MKIEFDAPKNDRNIHERSLSFERAANFDFETSRIWQDTRKPYPEERFLALGYLGQPLARLVLHPCEKWHSGDQFSQGQPT